MSASLPIARPQAVVAPAARPLDAAMRVESRVRMVVSSVILYLLAQGLYGSTWDIQWHGAVGRDSFFTPPHIFMYSSTTIAGLLALGFICWETWRFRKGDQAVTAANTTAFLGFHAPLGIYIVGFGVATQVLAAPFDNYWHELYGIDVTLWSPAHVMGMIGAFIAALGIIYAVGSELNRRRAAGERLWLGLGGPGVALILAFFGLLSVALVNVISAGYAERLWGLGAVTLANWPLIMAVAIPVCLVAPLVATARPGVATAIGLLVTAWQLTFAQSVIGMVDLLVRVQGLHYRDIGAGLQFPFIAFVSPLTIPLVGLVIDGAWWLTRRQPAMRMWVLPLAATFGVLMLTLIERPWMRQLDPATVYPDYWPIYLATLPVLLAAALLSGWAGAWWGRVIRSLRG